MMRQNVKQKMYNIYKDLDFVILIDNEKYFGLTGFQMSGNRHFYSPDQGLTPSDVATYSNKKFEPKVMLWLAISPKGKSRPVLTSGRIKLPQTVLPIYYITRFLNPYLVPFFYEKYPNGGCVLAR